MRPQPRGAGLIRSATTPVYALDPSRGLRGFKVLSPRETSPRNTPSPALRSSGPTPALAIEGGARVAGALSRQLDNTYCVAAAQTASVLGSGLREIPRLPSRAGSYLRRSMSWSLAAGLPTSEADTPPRPESAAEIRCEIQPRFSRDSAEIQQSAAEIRRGQHETAYTAAAYYCHFEYDTPNDTYLWNAYGTPGHRRG